MAKEAGLRYVSDERPGIARHYRAHAMRDAIAALGLKHRFTRPYTPKTHGNADRFIQTSLHEWACAHAYSHAAQRSDRLPLFLHNYNCHRPHHSLKLRSPVSRLRQPLNNRLSLHSWGTADLMEWVRKPLVGMIFSGSLWWWLEGLGSKERQTEADRGLISGFCR